jgi:hypothetical protein
MVPQLTQRITPLIEIQKWRRQFGVHVCISIPLGNDVIRAIGPDDKRFMRH